MMRLGGELTSGGGSRDVLLGAYPRHLSYQHDKTRFEIDDASELPGEVRLIRWNAWVALQAVKT
jgi:hypothetical protein